MRWVVLEQDLWEWRRRIEVKRHGTLRTHHRRGHGKNALQQIMILLSVIPNAVEYGVVRNLDTGRLKDPALSAFLSNAAGKEISQISTAQSPAL